MPRTIQQAQREGYDDGYEGREAKPKADPGSLTHESYMTGYATGVSDAYPEAERRSRVERGRTVGWDGPHA